MEVKLHHTFRLSAGGWLTHPESRRPAFTLGSPRREVTQSCCEFLPFHLPDFSFSAALWHVSVSGAEGAFQ